MSFSRGLFAAALCVSGTAFAAEESWIQDFAKAKEKAAAEKKDLLIDFTGSDWCIWCKRLDSEVFQAGDFEAKVQENFVLVKLDFPRDKSLVTPEIADQNKGLQSAYGIEGFPTIFLTDAAGRPYAKTGYEAGGPENYMTHLTTLRESKTKLDAALTKAAAAKGMDKAKALDEGLSLLDQSVLLPFYENEVKEILALDAKDEGGLKKKYDGLFTARAEKAALNELNEAVGPHFESEDWDAAIKAVDEFYAKYEKTCPGAAEQSMMAKSSILMQQGKSDEAMALADEWIAKLKDTKAESAQQFAMMKVGLFMQQQKFDDAVKAVEAAKALAPDSQIGQQAEMIVKQIKMAAGQAGGGDGDGN